MKTRMEAGKKDNNRSEKERAKIPSVIEISKDETVIYEDRDLKWHEYYTLPQMTTISNTGSSILLSGKWDKRKPFITGGPLNGSYVFSQIHFHLPSEHQIDGKRYPLEMHAVHYKSTYATQEKAMLEKDGTLVIVYLFQLSEKDSSLLSEIIHFKNQLRVVNSRITVNPKPLEKILKPFGSDYLLYWGSIVSAHTSYMLQWIISRTTLPVSEMQIKVLKKMLYFQKANWIIAQRLPPEEKKVFHVASYGKVQSNVPNLVFNLAEEGSLSNIALYGSVDNDLNRIGFYAHRSVSQDENLGSGFSSQVSLKASTTTFSVPPSLIGNVSTPKQSSHDSFETKSSENGNELLSPPLKPSSSYTTLTNADIEIDVEEAFHELPIKPLFLSSQSSDSENPDKSEKGQKINKDTFVESKSSAERRSLTSPRSSREHQLPFVQGSSVESPSSPKQKTPTERQILFPNKTLTDSPFLTKQPASVENRLSSTRRSSNESQSSQKQRNPAEKNFSSTRRSSNESQLSRKSPAERRSLTSPRSSQEHQLSFTRKSSAERRPPTIPRSSQERQVSFVPGPSVESPFSAKQKTPAERQILFPNKTSTKSPFSPKQPTSVENRLSTTRRSSTESQSSQKQRNPAEKNLSSEKRSSNESQSSQKQRAFSVERQLASNRRSSTESQSSQKQRISAEHKSSNERRFSQPPPTQLRLSAEPQPRESSLSKITNKKVENTRRVSFTDEDPDNKRSIDEEMFVSPMRKRNSKLVSQASNHLQDVNAITAQVFSSPERIGSLRQSEDSGVRKKSGQDESQKEDADRIGSNDILLENSQDDKFQKQLVKYDPRKEKDIDFDRDISERPVSKKEKSISFEQPISSERLVSNEEKSISFERPISSERPVSNEEESILFERPISSEWPVPNEEKSISFTGEIQRLSDAPQRVEKIDLLQPNKHTEVAEVKYGYKRLKNIGEGVLSSDKIIRTTINFVCERIEKDLVTEKKILIGSFQCTEGKTLEKPEQMLLELQGSYVYVSPLKDYTCDVREDDYSSGSDDSFRLSETSSVPKMGQDFFISSINEFEGNPEQDFILLSGTVDQKYSRTYLPANASNRPKSISIEFKLNQEPGTRKSGERKEFPTAIKAYRARYSKYDPDFNRVDVKTETKIPQPEVCETSVMPRTSVPENVKIIESEKEIPLKKKPSSKSYNTVYIPCLDYFVPIKLM